MSEAQQNFKIAIDDAEVLLRCFDSMNRSDVEAAPEVLKRATLIMVLTAWETYVEDVATELFNGKFGILKGCHVGSFLDEQFELRLKTFHNPDSVMRRGQTYTFDKKQKTSKRKRVTFIDLKQ